MVQEAVQISYTNMGNLKIPKEYLKILHFAMAQVHAELLAENGQCQDGFAAGDWSDGSGECCCQSESEAPTTDETAISGKLCQSVKKVCLCRLPQTTSALPYKLSRTSTPSSSLLTSSTPYLVSKTPAPTLQSTTQKTTTFVQRGLVPFKLARRFSTSPSSTPL